MKMNLPNKLTVLRVILIPFFVAFMIMSDNSAVSMELSADMIEGLSEAAGAVIGGADGPTSMFIAGKGAALGYSADMTMRIIACVIFCAASFTDFLDGYIARKNNLVTNFGKFMDPLADKLLVCSALILITVYSPYVPVWAVLIIIAREFIISGFRLVASDNGIVIAASKWGKLKTVSQMALCILGILNIPALFSAGEAVFIALTVIVLILTVVSLADYIIKNKEVLTKGGM